MEDRSSIVNISWLYINNNNGRCCSACTASTTTTTTTTTITTTHTPTTTCSASKCAHELAHFKPEYSGKPEEDVEAHLLRTNDWMNTHDFSDGVKVHRFCLTLTGEARLWYASLEPVVMTWPELQNQFRRQYSKLGNTREQLFHAWRSFHYDENVEMPMHMLLE